MLNCHRYPQDKETEEDLQRILSAQRTLRSYHRRFRVSQENILRQLKGNFLFREFRFIELDIGIALAICNNIN